jgi:NhaP-type Na+/H+ or K+/H+ antiporter
MGPDIRALGLPELLSYALQNVLIGVGVGVIAGLILFKYMSRYFAKEISLVLLFCGIGAAFVAAINLGGSGMIACSVMGIFFGSMRIKRKDLFYAWNGRIVDLLGIPIFVLIGLVIPFDGTHLFEAAILLMMYLAARWLSVSISLDRSIYGSADRAMAIMQTPKGVAVASLLLFASGSLVAIEMAFFIMAATLVMSMLLSLSSPK